MNQTLPNPVSGERITFSGKAGPLSIFVAGSGPALLLVHSINAAGCGAEVRPLHEHYRKNRTVFTVDLPGFGLSDRSDRSYSPRLMTDAVLSASEQVRKRCGPEPFDALAVSLGCEYLARAAVESPDLYRSIALVSPTGFNGKGGSRRGAPGSTREIPLMHRVLRGPGDVWGGPLFRALTRPPVIRYFLERAWGQKKIDETLWEYDVLTTRQPGAEHAPLHFLSGKLFSADIHSIYERLTMPVWMSHGVRGDFTDYQGKELVASRENWQFTVFQTGAMPYFEQTEHFTKSYDTFLASATRESATPPVETSPQ